MRAYELMVIFDGDLDEPPGYANKGGRGAEGHPLERVAVDGGERLSRRHVDRADEAAGPVDRGLGLVTPC